MIKRLLFASSQTADKVPNLFYLHELEMETLESLVPAEHLVRKIAKASDLEFICDRGLGHC